MYDVIIVGGGPAAVAAGVYAARKKMKMALVAESFGGQSLVSAGIENWIGTKSVSGFDFSQMLEEHLRAQEDIEIYDGDLVVAVSPVRSFARAKGASPEDLGEATSNGMGGVSSFIVTTKSGKNFDTKTILVCSGSRRRRLGIPGEDKLDGKGVAWCSTCDAPLFKGKDVAVIGAGNAGLEAVRDLFSYAAKVYLLNRTEKIRGDAQTFEEIKTNSKLEVINNAEPKEILGEQFVSGVRYLDTQSKSEKNLAVGGVFVEVGSLPNADFVKDLVKLDNWGQIIVDHKTQATSLPGIWAAGDVSDVLYKQNNISAGDAVKAVLNIYDYLNKK